MVVVGDENTGKSALIERFISEKEDGNLHLTHDVTTVLDVKSKVVNVENKNIVIHVWDVGGSMDPHIRERVAYSNADLVIIAFSKTDPESLESVKVKWSKEVEKCLPYVPIILIGTKKDEITDEAKEVLTGKVITSAGSKVESMIKAKHFIECSSLFDENVKEVFDKGIRTVMDQRKKIEEKKRKLTKMSSKSFDQTAIQEMKLEKFEDFLGISYDHECLIFLQQLNGSEVRAIDTQLNAIQTSFLYVVCQRCFAKSLKYFLKTFSEEAEEMMMKMDATNRTPIMVASDSTVFGIVDEFMNKKAISQSYGKDADGRDIPLVNLYINFKFEELAKRIIETAKSEERKVFLNLKDDEGNSILLNSETSETLGNFIIENYIDELEISTKNHIGKNVAHIFSKKGYKVSNFLSKINKETTFDLLSQQDWHGNTPLMACARYGNQAALACFLTFYFDLTVSRNTNIEDVRKVDEMLHVQNKEGHNLTYLVFIHKQELHSPYSTVHELEKYVHNLVDEMNDGNREEDIINKDEQRVQGMQKYMKCLRENQISKMEIKSIKNAIDENQIGSKFVLILVLSLGSFWFPVGTYMLDVSTDSTLTKDHYEAWMDLNETNSTCNPNSTQLTDYPHCLGPFYKFIYSSAFMKCLLYPAFSCDGLTSFSPLTTSSAPSPPCHPLPVSSCPPPSWC